MAASFWTIYGINVYGAGTFERTYHTQFRIEQFGFLYAPVMSLRYHILRKQNQRYVAFKMFLLKINSLQVAIHCNNKHNSVEHDSKRKYDKENKQIHTVHSLWIATPQTLFIGRCNVC